MLLIYGATARDYLQIREMKWKI